MGCVLGAELVCLYTQRPLTVPEARLVEPSADNSNRCTPICLYVLCAPTYSKPREWLPLNSSQFDWVLSGFPELKVLFGECEPEFSVLASPRRWYSAVHQKNREFCDSHALANVDPADSYSSLCSFKTSKFPSILATSQCIKLPT